MWRGGGGLALVVEAAVYTHILIQSRFVQSSIKLTYTRISENLDLILCNFSVKFSVHIVRSSVFQV